MKFIIKLIDKLIEHLSVKETVTIEEFHNRYNANKVSIPDVNGRLKFIEEIAVDDVLTYGTNGLVPVKYSRKTVEYEKYKISFNNSSIECADKHIFVVDGKELYAKDLKPNDLLQHKSGKYVVVESVKRTGVVQNMYDLEIDSTDHTYYTNDVLSHNSVTVAAGFLLHQIIFGEGIQCAIVANKKSLAAEMLGRLKFAFECLPLWLKPGVKVWNKGKIELDNNCFVMAESSAADSLRGNSLNLVIIDEAGFIDNFEDFWISTLPTMSSGQTSKIIVISTPNGDNLYKKIYTEAVNGENGFLPLSFKWDVVPERTPEWREQEIKRIGLPKFQQEYECSFSATENTLVSLAVIDAMNPQVPVETRSNERLRIFKQPVEGHTYVIAFDGARGILQDYCVAQVIDITEEKYEQVAVYRSNDVKPIYMANVLYELGHTYNHAYIIAELNKSADILNDLFYNLEYENLLRIGKDKKTGRQILGGSATLGLLQSTTTKIKGCLNLKMMIEGKKLEIYDSVTMNELRTFVKDGESYSADANKKDDCVMSLVIFAWMVTQGYYVNHIVEKASSNIFDQAELYDILPFGIIINGNEDDVELDRKIYDTTSKRSSWDEWIMN